MKSVNPFRLHVLLVAVLLAFQLISPPHICESIHTTNVQVRTSEVDCNIVSTKGILKSTDFHASGLDSSPHNLVHRNFSSLKDGVTIYVHGSAIHQFYQTLAKIKVKFVLVSGDCDNTMPYDVLRADEFEKFITNPNMLHWFTQNTNISHPKMTIIPIGLNYHTLVNGHWSWGSAKQPLEQERLLMQVATNALPLQHRALRCYVNFKASPNMKKRFISDRTDALAQIPSSLTYAEEISVNRMKSWTTQSFYSFVISPHGNGYDCHRTWEALVLGSIPIVKTSPIDALYDGLPVLIVKQWSDVTAELLRATRERLAPMFEAGHVPPRLTLKYWMDLINSKRVP